MQEKLKELAQRIYALRDIYGYSIADMAEATGLTNEEYEAHEKGEKDLTFTFLYNVARKFGIDMTELFTGSTPHLSTYSVIRKGEALPIERKRGFKYHHLAYLVRNRIAEPFVVYAKYDQKEDESPLELNYHEGQEFDYILEGYLRCSIDGKEFVLGPGDALYYNSSHGHGMAATKGQDCKFLAVVMKYKDKEEK